MSLVHRAVASLDAGLRLWTRLPRAVRWLGVGTIMAVLWWSSSQTPPVREPSVARNFLLNGMHVVAFGTLAATAWFALHAPKSQRDWLSGLIAIGLAIAYGIVDELHQSHVPGRVCSISDVLSDTVGAVLAVWAVRWRVDRARATGVQFALLLLAAAASVTLATFGPW